jgi:hypothetical protein
MMTVPSLSSVKVSLSPAFSPKQSRISRGTVTCPFRVRVVASAMIFLDPKILQIKNSNI